MVVAEIAKIREIKFAKGVCFQICAAPQETCYESVCFSAQVKKMRVYSGIVREAVVAMMVAGLNIVIEKMYAWIRERRDMVSERGGIR